MTALLFAVALFLTPQSTHPCDSPAGSAFTVKAETVVLLSWCQPATKAADGSIVKTDFFVLRWNGNSLDVSIGAEPGPQVAAPMGPANASGAVEYRTTMFFSAGTHRISVIAGNVVNGVRQLSSASTEIVVTADGDPPPQPVDCVVSDWVCSSSEWSACSADGMQTRTLKCSRTIITEPANGGQACPALTETRTESQSCEPPPPSGDTEAPTISGVSVVRSGKSHNYTVTVRAVDNVGIVKVVLRLDGQIAGTVNGPLTSPYAFTLQIKEAGTHTIEAVVSDAAGNNASATVQIVR